MAATRLPEQKVILCGEYGAGKSSIFRRYTNNTFVTSTDRGTDQGSNGLDHFSKSFTVNERDVKMALWDTGGMERVASVTSSYYKFAEGAILVFALDNASSFHALSQHLLDIVSYAETAKIFLCGNNSDLVGKEPQVTETDIEEFMEQCQNLISGTYKISCKTGEGIDEMFADIAGILTQTNRSRLEFQSLEQHGFRVEQPETNESNCKC